MNKVIGIDFGNTITYNILDSTTRVPFPDVVRVVNSLSSRYPCHIISKVTPQQKKNVLAWMATNNFLTQLGIPLSNVHFCNERHEKNEICVRLGVTHHIDDRPEVVSHLNLNIKAFLFRPIAEDVVKFFPALKLRDVYIVQNWLEIEKFLL